MGFCLVVDYFLLLLHSVDDFAVALGLFGVHFDGQKRILLQRGLLALLLLSWIVAQLGGVGSEQRRGLLLQPGRELPLRVLFEIMGFGLGIMFTLFLPRFARVPERRLGADSFLVVGRFRGESWVRFFFHIIRI